MYQVTNEYWTNFYIVIESDILQYGKK